MLFNSLEFLLFLFVVIAIYYIIPQKYKNVFLLVTSYIFYSFCGIKYAILLLILSLFAYIFGILIEKNKSKSILFIGIVVYLGFLVFYKYANFSIDIVNSIFKSNINSLDIIAPLGISFYTFQIIAYLVDVYRKKINAEKNFITLFLYISFFPKLIVGPLENPKNMINQINSPKEIDWNKFWRGFIFILYGYFLKLVIADRAGMLVDTIYGNYETYKGLYLVIATLVYSIQIYCDFMGYTYIALGVAKLLGFDLIDNFKSPYLSTSTNGFWKNWHISLTSWFREYLYIPLGGNRKGKLRKFINKMIVFIASGLWHGASFNFVIWSALNGLYVIVEELVSPLQKKIESILKFNSTSRIYSILATIRSFILISFSWIFFRAETLDKAVNIIKSIFTTNNFNILFNGSLFDFELGLGAKNTLLLIVLVLILLVIDFYKQKGKDISNFIINRNFIIRGVIIAGVILFILLFGKYGPNMDMSTFIYSRF